MKEYVFDTSALLTFIENEEGIETETGYGDYTKERNKFLGNPALEELVKDIQASEYNKKT